MMNFNMTSDKLSGTGSIRHQEEHTSIDLSNEKQKTSIS